MELFKLFGSIFVEDTQAKRALESVADKAESTATRMKLAFAGVGAVLATSLIPAMAVAGGGALALGASFAAAGIGAGAFGAVAVGVLSDVFEASKNLTEAQKELTLATTAEEREAALQKQKEAMAGLSGEQAKAVQSLQAFKTFWGDFTKQFETPVVQAFGTSLDILKGILEGLAPTITNVAGVINELLTKFNTDLQNGQFKQFFDWLATNGAESLYSFAQIFGNVFAGITNILMAFAPLGASVEEGLVGMTQRFAEWSSTIASSQGFKQFIDYLKANGPVLIDVVKQIFTTLVEVGVALAPLGQTLLGIIQEWMPAIKEFAVGIAEGLGGISAPVAKFIIIFGSIVGVLGMVITAVAPFITAIAGLIPVITKVWSWASKAFTAIRTFAAGFALFSNPIGIAIAVIGLLIGAIVLLWNKSDTFRNVCIAVWNAVKSAIVAAGQGIMSFLSTLAGWIGGTLTAIWGGLKSAWLATWGAIKSGVVAIVSGFKSAIQGIIQGTVAVLSAIWNALKGAWSATWNAIRSVVVSVASGIQGAVTSVLQGAVSVVSSIWNGISGAWSSAWGTLSGIVSGAVEGIKGIIGSVQGTIDSIIGGIQSAIAWAAKLPGIGGGGDKKKKKKNANGTDFFEGGWTVVGEQGRELVKLPTGSQVIPNHSLPKDGLGGGSVTQNITINSPRPLNASETARQMKKASRQLALGN